MTKGDWLDLTVLERRKYNLLVETMDLSQQLGEAVAGGYAPRAHPGPGGSQEGH